MITVEMKTAKLTPITEQKFEIMSKDDARRLKNCSYFISNRLILQLKSC